LQSILDEVRAADAEVLAICRDSVEDNARMAKKLGLEFSVLSDPDLTVTKTYDLLHAEAAIDGGDIARPAVFTLDREGVIRYRALTDNWRVRVRPETFLEQLTLIP